MQRFPDEKPINPEKFLFLPKIRLECIDLERNHYKFYEIEAQPALFYPIITKRWGRIGSKSPRTKLVSFTYFNEMKQELIRILKTRYNHGYKLNEEIPL